MRTVTVACTGATDGTVAAWDLTAVAASIADALNTVALIVNVRLRCSLR